MGYERATIITFGWWRQTKLDEFKCVADVYRPGFPCEEVGISLTRKNNHGSVKWTMICKDLVVSWSTVESPEQLSSWAQAAHRQSEAHTSNYLT